MSREYAKNVQGLPERLRQNRKMRGLTQAELGAKAGIAAASVSHFETGQRAPSVASLVRLADALELSTDTLLGRGSANSTMRVDPIFLRASRSSAKTLDLVKKVTEALMDESQEK
ncbi:helix-turn-helix domain-containing protein [Candidatus Palauibacter sp.]|uniref:helix-turn-helix domain-containing protein n=1 Tax=Candidatus Palauibacter sp. TaxID=3101350 RepID=UPI003B5B0264